MTKEQLKEIDDEIEWWTKKHHKGSNEANFTAFGIVTGLKLAKAIALCQEYEK